MSQLDQRIERAESLGRSPENYEAHVEYIQHIVPQEKLLVFNCKQGWLPLCTFLGVPIPREPFPRVNDSALIIAALARGKRMVSPIYFRPSPLMR